MSHLIDDLVRGTDKNDLRLFASPGKVRILSKEPVTGMNGIYPVFLCALDDPLDIQEFRDRFIKVLGKVNNLVCLLQVPGIGLLCSFDHIGLYTHLPGGLNDPDSYLASVGY